MDIEELLSGRRRGKHGKKHDYHHREDGVYRPNRTEHDPLRGDHGHHIRISEIYTKICSLSGNKSIVAVVTVGVLLILILGIALLAVLFPLLMRAIDYIGQNGLQGAANYILAFMQNLWNGTA